MARSLISLSPLVSFSSVLSAFPSFLIQGSTNVRLDPRIFPSASPQSVLSVHPPPLSVQVGKEKIFAFSGRMRSRLRMQPVPFFFFLFSFTSWLSKSHLCLYSAITGRSFLPLISLCQAFPFRFVLPPPDAFFPSCPILVCLAFLGAEHVHNSPARFFSLVSRSWRVVPFPFDIAQEFPGIFCPLCLILFFFRVPL